MGFAYEVRKAYEDQRLTEKLVANGAEVEYVGFNFLWTDLLILLSVARNCAGYVITNELDQANLLMLEWVTKNAMVSYDPEGARTLVEFIGQRIDIADPMLTQISEYINLKYLNEKPSKKRFRTIVDHLIAFFSPWTKAYQEMQAELEVKALELNCEVKDLQFDEKGYPETILW